MGDIAQRLARLRQHMARQELDAVVVPRADEYLGEYLPAHHERLHWISNFSGSAGVAIVLPTRAAIFVDGRYTVQVRQQVSPQLFEILHLSDTPHLDWLVRQLAPGARVGYDPRMHPLSWQQAATARLAGAGLQLHELEHNLIDLSWRDRPRPAIHPALLLDERYSGQASLSKRREVAATVAAQGATAALIFAADSSAWLLNIRGRDVPNSPLVLGFSLLYEDGRLQFFTDPDKIPDRLCRACRRGRRAAAGSRRTGGIRRTGGADRAGRPGHGQRLEPVVPAARRGTAVGGGRSGAVTKGL